MHVAGVGSLGVVSAGLRLLCGIVGEAAVASDLGGLLLRWKARGGEGSVSVVGGWCGGRGWLLLLWLVVEEARRLGRVRGKLLYRLAEGGLAVEGGLIRWR